MGTGVNGRRKPYSMRTIHRIPCASCGKPSSEQWHVRPCALGRYVWKALCLDCDIALNRQTIEFFRLEGGAEMLERYEAKVRADA